MSTPAEKPRSTEWLEDWDPQDESKWDSKIAWTTLTITTFSLTMAFASWFLPSAIIPKLTTIGFQFDNAQLYWMTSMVGLSAGILRLVWMILPPIMGTRKLVTVTSLLMVLPLVGWGFAVQDLSTPYWVFMLLAFIAGIGGGAFSGFMPSTSYFFPKRLQGTALGLQAGIGNFGVSLVQLLTPWLIGFAMVGWLGAAQTEQLNGATRSVWYQNSAFIWIPLTLICAVLAWILLKSVPIKANIKQQFDIFSNPDTWWMTYLYIMTFGTFSGLSALFGLLMKNLYGLGNPALVAAIEAGALPGYSIPDPAAYAFLGPLVGAGARVLFAPLTDKMGGAIWTLISGIGMAISIAFTTLGLVPDLSSTDSVNRGFTIYLWGMLAIFLFSGIGNASTFKQMPMIFEPRQAGGVIGWTAATAAFGPFMFGVALTLGVALHSTLGAVAFYFLGVAFAIGGVIITWQRYARKGAPKPS
ncbi:MFS transporter [Arachnia propionica]|uniref:MFS transporter n=1 Tax=Arachnia propionica TaxID=1750 RepID=UPI0030D01C32